MDTDKEIFKGMSLSGLFEEIHTNATTTRTQINGVIGELKPLIENIGDATVIIPIIKDFMDLRVKSDDSLLKLATIIQRMEASVAKGESLDGFDFSELQDLLEEQEEVEKEVKEVKEQKKKKDE